MNPDYGKGSPDRLLKDPFVLRDSTGNTHEFQELSGHKGYDRLESIFQSTSLDDVKLQILKSVNENKLTMGATAVMAALADDSVKENGEPLFSEEYLGYYIAQPILMEFVTKMSSGNDSLEASRESDFKERVVQELKDKYLIPLEAEDPILAAKPYIGYNLNDLKAAIYHEKEFNETETITSSADDFTVSKYRKMQADILDMFLAMADRAEVVRLLQDLVNTDSKGTPKSVTRALFKLDSFNNMMRTLPTSIGNVERVFLTKDNEPNLTHTFFNIGVKLPISLFKGSEQTGPI